MSSSEQENEQERAWGIMYDRMIEVLQPFGKEDYRGRADYVLVDDNYGIHQHKIEIQNLRMLQPAVVRSLQQVLNEFPNWEIVIAVDVPGTQGRWPRMGITIRRHEIVDDLKRQWLPREFVTIKY